MQKINLIFFSLIIIFLSKVYAEEKNLVFDIYPFNEDGTINEGGNSTVIPKTNILKLKEIKNL